MSNALEHPDAITDYYAFKQIAKGGRQEQQTEAMNAYYDVVDSRGSKEEAEQAYKNVHKKYSDGKYESTGVP